MANHKSAIRQWRKSLRRNTINRRNKSILRSEIKNIRTVIQSKDRETAETLLPETVSTIDRAVKKGAIHANTGNRYKSRLSQQVASITAAAPK
ncbi:MAG: 30S ribosomal protein S20 [Acidobacteria bacterium]|nr:30S ribosomal protein S20 [Acidobacteriota bacterium]MBU4253087.1 30S ribosomal protein S20 [Acidobacteriota bacterium]